MDDDLDAAPSENPMQSDDGSSGAESLQGSDPEGPDDNRVADLEGRVQKLTEALEGMSSEKSELEGVAEKFRGMEDRMKSLLQLSEVLSVRYNPFLSNEEGDVFDGNRHNPSNLIPRERRPAPAEPEPPRPSEVLRPPPAPVEDRFRGEVVRVDADVPEPGPVVDLVAANQVPESGLGNESLSEESESETDSGRTAEQELDDELDAALAPFEDDLPVKVLEEVQARSDGPALEQDDEASEESEEIRDSVEADLEPPRLEEIEAPDAAGELEDEPLAEDLLSGKIVSQLFEPSLEPPPEHSRDAPSEPDSKDPGVPLPTESSDPGSAHRVVPASYPSPPVSPLRPASVAQPGPSPPFTPPGRSRESYLVLCWFERLALESDPSEIHLFVDHYAGLGWIPPEHHGWMAYLADSIAPRPLEASWADVDIPAHDLARLHRRNLRFLDRLFRVGLGVDDPLRWDDEAQWWMEGD